MGQDTDAYGSLQLTPQPRDTLHCLLLLVPFRVSPFSSLELYNGGSRYGHHFFNLNPLSRSLSFPYLHPTPRPCRPSSPSSSRAHFWRARPVNPITPETRATNRHLLYDGTIAGKVSGCTWKHVRTQRASATRVSRRTPSFELRTKEKELKRGYKERMGELKAEIRSNKVEKRKKREEREKKKKENVLKSGTKLQKITNPKTLKKIAKSKDRKLLKVVPDEFVNGGNKGKRK